MNGGNDMPPFFDVYAAIAACLYLVDVGFNSSLEYGDLPGQYASDKTCDSIVTFVQVLLQITALINLFVLLGGTFLFRSGLFGMLYSHFHYVLLVHMLYICLTILLAVYRMDLLSSGSDYITIWDVDGYALLSGVHKIGALGYYACTIFAIEQLRNRKYYSHEYWVRK